MTFMVCAGSGGFGFGRDSVRFRSVILSGVLFGLRMGTMGLLLFLRRAWLERV